MIDVTCAIIIKEGKYLICQRSERMKMPLKWEFPGGKVEINESLQSCLQREIKEELNVNIYIIKKLNKVIHHYDNFSISLYPFICEIRDGDISLKEHNTYQWVDLHEINKYDLASADKPILSQL
ncbi:MAG: (deoxy)nucleoside triphosphate pyrophosphohydrolase [Pedobacter sp.]|nr:MAG: (deoxy)nucleoside triphosphate pyrophosphohydrolase [Pedobacter sp.]